MADLNSTIKGSWKLEQKRTTSPEAISQLETKWQTEAVLNWDIEETSKYEWFKKISIEVNWKNKEVYLENENLKVDSTNWEKTEIDWYDLKINPEWDIIEFIQASKDNECSELWGNMIWAQLFTHEAAIREAKNEWKRLPNENDNNPEFQAIVDKIWMRKLSHEFGSFTPHSEYLISSDSMNITHLWSASLIDNEAFYMKIDHKNYYASRDYSEIKNFFSVRCIKD